MATVLDADLTDSGWASLSLLTGDATESYTFTGDIYEAVVFNEALSTDDHAAVVAYLKTKHGIS